MIQIEAVAKAKEIREALEQLFAEFGHGCSGGLMELTIFATLVNENKPDAMRTETVYGKLGGVRADLGDNDNYA